MNIAPNPTGVPPPPPLPSGIPLMSRSRHGFVGVPPPPLPGVIASRSMHGVRAVPSMHGIPRGPPVVRAVPSAHSVYDAQSFHSVAPWQVEKGFRNI